MKKTLASLSKKILTAAGGLSVLVFLIGIAVTIFTRLLIR